MSATISHNEAVINRRLADLRALDPGNAQCWENLIEILKANGAWTPATIARTLGSVVATLIAVEDMQKTEVL